jgi:hypothetical protein
MKHAFLITVYNNFEQLEKLVNYIKSYDKNDVFIHVDANVDNDIYQETMTNLQEKAVFVESIPSYWGSFNFIKAELNLFQTAFNYDNYSYFHLISGQDFPIKNLDYIYNYCEDRYPTNFIDVYEFQKSKINYDSIDKYIDNCELEKDLINRVNYYYPLQTTIKHKKFAKLIGFFGVAIQKVFRISRIDMAAKEGVKFFKGSTWNSMSNQYVKLFLEKYNSGWVEKYFDQTLIPEEEIHQTLICNSDLKYQNNSVSWHMNLREDDWSRPSGTGPHIWQKDELKNLIETATPESLFSRKFNNEDVDELITLLRATQ